MPIPTAADVIAALNALPSFSIPASFSAERALDTTLKEWESLTGWLPFTQDDVNRTVFFDPPGDGSFGCVTDLRRGLLSTYSVVTGCAPDGSGGTVATIGEDFLLRPYDGGVSERPFTSFEWLTYPSGGRRSIKVVGLFGYCADWPADAFDAVVGRAVSLALPLAQGPAGALKRVEQGPVQYEYDTTAGRDTRSVLIAEFRAAANRRRGPWL
jgi:hypothetical protein